MAEITLLAMGKLKERFYTDAAAEYAKRLGAFGRFRLTELPEERLPDAPSAAQITAALEKEADAIFAKIPKGAYLCVFTPEGQMLSSEEFSQRLTAAKLSGKSSLCFVIGSSFGLSPRLKTAAALRVSMGAMTFPHHLARVMVLEQLYRAQAIASGSKYHK